MNTQFQEPAQTFSKLWFVTTPKYVVRPTSYYTKQFPFYSEMLLSLHFQFLNNRNIKFSWVLSIKIKPGTSKFLLRIYKFAIVEEPKDLLWHKYGIIKFIAIIYSKNVLTKSCKLVEAISCACMLT